MCKLNVIKCEYPLETCLENTFYKQCIMSSALTEIEAFTTLNMSNLPHHSYDQYILTSIYDIIYYQQKSFLAQASEKTIL